MATPPISLPNTTAAEFLRREIPRASMKGLAWECLIAALAVGEQRAWDNAPLIERQLFLATASETWLDRRAAGLGVERPRGVGMGDDHFREFAIQTAGPQQTIVAILEMLGIFYGDEGTRAHHTTAAEPFAFAIGNYVTYLFDGRNTVTATLAAADFANIAAATVDELNAVLNRAFRSAGVSAFAVVYVSPTTGLRHTRVFSGTLGARGIVEVVDSDIFTVDRYRLLDQDGAAYLLTHEGKSIEVFLPAITRVVSRTLADACYISADHATPGVGPYLYDQDGVSVTETSTTTTVDLWEGHQYRLVSVANTNNFPDGEGWVVFGFGYGYQSGPVRYIGKSGATTIAIDPGFSFPFSVPSGSRVNLLVDDEPPEWFSTGAFVLTDSASGRVAAGEAVDAIGAAGYDIQKTITYPGDYGLGNAGFPTSGQEALSDIVPCFAGSDVDTEMAEARSE